MMSFVSASQRAETCDCSQPVRCAFCISTGVRVVDGTHVCIYCLMKLDYLEIRDQQEFDPFWGH